MIGPISPAHALSSARARLLVLGGLLLAALLAVCAGQGWLLAQSRTAEVEARDFVAESRQMTALAQAQAALNGSETRSLGERTTLLAHHRTALDAVLPALDPGTQARLLTQQKSLYALLNQPGLTPGEGVELAAREARFERELAAVNQERETVFRSTVEDQASALTRSSWMTIAGILLLLVAGVLLAMHALRRVIRPLSDVTAALHDLEHGVVRQITSHASAPEGFDDVHRAIDRLGTRTETLQRLAFADALTGLPNRTRLIADIARQAALCRTADGGAGMGFALIIFDLAEFRDINDSFGLEIGDACLRVASERLLALLPPGAGLYRHHGDEFVLLTAPQSMAEFGVPHALLLAREGVAQLAERAVVEGQGLNLDSHAGVALYPDHARFDAELVVSAEAAVHQAQSQHNPVALAVPGHWQRLRERFALVDEIRRGLKAGEFRPFYQPVVDVRSGRVSAVEALMRWHHPERGWVLPGEFIPVAETSGLIHAIGEACLEIAARDAKRWHDAGTPRVVAINVSVRQLYDPGFVPRIERVLAETGLPPELLELEITESEILGRIEETVLVLDRLRELGIGLASDDFGTGYSSLSYLHRLPMSKLKIDRSFIVRLGQEDRLDALVSAVVSIGRALGMTVVSEGVETTDQLRRLMALGCSHIQGWLFSKAIPGEDLDGWVRGAVLRADDVLGEVIPLAASDVRVIPTPAAASSEAVAA